MTRLLILLAPDGDPPRWLRLSGDRVVAEGKGLPAPDPEASVTLALPGEHVGIAWLDLPALAPAQAAAAARLLIADRVAPAPESLHVAVAPGEGVRVVAWVAMARLDAWLAELAAAGIVPDSILPDPLLLPPPPPGQTMVWREAERLLVRSSDDAFAMEAAVADLLLADRTAVPVDDWRHGLSERLAAPPVDLRQGRFAPARRWQAGGWRWSRLAALAAAFAALWIAADAAAWLRASLAAELLEQQLADTARAALPRGSVVTAATALPQLRERAARLGAAGGFAAAAAPLLDGIAGQPRAGLGRLDYGAGAGLSATLVEGDRDAVLAAMAGAGASGGGPQEIRVTP